MVDAESESHKLAPLPALSALATPALVRQQSPLRRPTLRVDIPRSSLHQSSLSVPDAPGHERKKLLGAHAKPLSTPVTPLDGESATVPHGEMFSDISPAAKLGDEIARIRFGHAGGGAAAAARAKHRPAPDRLGKREDLDEGIGEVVIDIPVDVSPYVDTLMRAPPPSQGRVLCRLEASPRAHGETLFTLAIEESGVLLLVALHRAQRRDVLIGMYERELESNYLGTVRSDQPGIFVLEGARKPSGEAPCQYACVVHGTHQAGDMPVMNMMEAALPSCPYREAACAADATTPSGGLGARPPPSPSAALAWPPAELERWLREHDDSVPQRDASLLTMRLPKWNPVTKLLTLNFFERASVASAQNFQLTPFGDPDKAVLLFGKRSERLYSLDFMAPLSPFAALGIALTVVDW